MHAGGDGAPAVATVRGTHTMYVLSQLGGKNADFFFQAAKKLQGPLGPIREARESRRRARDYSLCAHVIVCKISIGQIEHCAGNIARYKKPPH